MVSGCEKSLRRIFREERERKERAREGKPSGEGRPERSDDFPLPLVVPLAFAPRAQPDFLSDTGYRTRNENIPLYSSINQAYFSPVPLGCHPRSAVPTSQFPPGAGSEALPIRQAHAGRQCRQPFSSGHRKRNSPNETNTRRWRGFWDVTSPRSLRAALSIIFQRASIYDANCVRKKFLSPLDKYIEV
jgi:hypothetical protein